MVPLGIFGKNKLVNLNYDLKFGRELILLSLKRLLLGIIIKYLLCNNCITIVSHQLRCIILLLDIKKMGFRKTFKFLRGFRE